MNRKAEKVARILNMSVNDVINELDRGMWDILIELNSKNYFTNGSCEGHLKEDGSWNGYIGFQQPYKFFEYPKEYDSSRQKRYFYWSGKGEDSRREFLENLYEWALSLPMRDLKVVKTYTLWGKNKNRPNSKWKVLRSSNDYEDIKIELNRKQTKKYELDFKEEIVRRY